MNFDEWLADTAPRDIRDTLAWLTGHGFRQVRRLGGPDTSFGNVALTYRRGDHEVNISRDRGQWELHFRMDGEAFGIDLVRDVRLGRSDWTYRPAGKYVEQLPEDLSWSAEVPAALKWMATTPEATTLLRREHAQRSQVLRDLFPWYQADD